MITNEQIEQAVRGARMSANAYDELIELFTTVECEWQTGGMLFYRRKGSHYNPMGTQPYRQIATVLPFGYEPRKVKE